MSMLRWLDEFKALAGVDIGGLESLKCGAARCCGAALNIKNKSFVEKCSIQWRVYPQAFAQDGYSLTACALWRKEEQVPVFGAGTCSERGRYVEYNLHGSLVSREAGEHPVFPVESGERLRGAGSRGRHGRLLLG